MWTQKYIHFLQSEQNVLLISWYIFITLKTSKAHSTEVLVRVDDRPLTGSAGSPCKSSCNATLTICLHVGEAHLYVHYVLHVIFPRHGWHWCSWRCRNVVSQHRHVVCTCVEHVGWVGAGSNGDSGQPGRRLDCLGEGGAYEDPPGDDNAAATPCHRPL